MSISSFYVSRLVFSLSWMVIRWELYHKKDWAPKNWCYPLWCWRRLLRVPWSERRSNQSLLQEINVEYSVEGLILRLKQQNFGHLMWRVNSLEKTLMLGKIKDKGEWGGRGWDGCFSSLTQWTWIWARSGRRQRTGKLGVLQSMGLQRVGHDLVTEQQSLVYKKNKQNWISQMLIAVFKFHCS